MRPPPITNPDPAGSSTPQIQTSARGHHPLTQHGPNRPAPTRQLTSLAEDTRHIRTTRRPSNPGPNPDSGAGTRQRPGRHHAGGCTAPQAPDNGATPTGSEAGENPGSDAPPGSHRKVDCYKGCWQEAGNSQTHGSHATGAEHPKDLRGAFDRGERGCATHATNLPTTEGIHGGRWSRKDGGIRRQEPRGTRPPTTNGASDRH